MPQNQDNFKAVVATMGQVKREWFTDDKNKVFRAYEIDTTGIYHAVLGLGLYSPELYEYVTNCIKHLISEELI